jgi:hypothetical protein
MVVMVNVFVKWAGGLFPAPFLFNAIVAKMVGKSKNGAGPDFSVHPGRRLPTLYLSGDFPRCAEGQENRLLSYHVPVFQDMAKNVLWLEDRKG